MWKVVLMTLIIAFILTNIGMCETYDDEILFRGIPWGSNISVVIKELGTQNILASDEQYLYDWETLPSALAVSQFKYPTGFSVVTLMHKINVAGYDASITAYCMYGLDDGTILRDEHSSKLYIAVYRLSVVDYHGAYADIKDKLTQLYGEGNETTETDVNYYFDEDGVYPCNAITCSTTWQGANNTQVMLYMTTDEREGTEYSFSKMRIIYGKTDIDAELEALDAAAYREALRNEIDGRNDDIDGL